MFPLLPSHYWFFLEPTGRKVSLTQNWKFKFVVMVAKLLLFWTKDEERERERRGEQHNTRLVFSSTSFIFISFKLSKSFLQLKSWRESRSCWVHQKSRVWFADWINTRKHYGMRWGRARESFPVYIALMIFSLGKFFKFNMRKSLSKRKFNL